MVQVIQMPLGLNDLLCRLIAERSVLPVFDPPSSSSDKGGQAAGGQGAGQATAAGGQAAAAAVLGGIAGAAAAGVVGVVNFSALEVSPESLNSKYLDGLD